MDGFRFKSIALVPALPIFFLMVAGGIPGTASGADAFLDAIQQAVETAEIDTSNQKSLSNQPPATPTRHRPEASPQTGAKPDMPTDLSQQDFEAYLQKHYFGSFTFYRKLDTHKQQQVYEAYRQQPVIVFVRKKITDSYLNRGTP